MTGAVVLTVLVVETSVLLALALAAAVGLAWWLRRRRRVRQRVAPVARHAEPHGNGSGRWEFRGISNERITLGVLRPSDIEPLYAMLSDPDNFTFELEGPRSREQVAEMLERDVTRTRLEKPGDYIHAAIRNSRGDFLGTIYLGLQSATPHRTADAGCTLLPSARGLGNATEAARLLLDVAFNELGLHRVYAECDLRNTASIGILERVGLRPEGRFLESVWVKGQWVDVGLYAILDHEWRRIRSAAT